MERSWRLKTILSIYLLLFLTTCDSVDELMPGNNINEFSVVEKEINLPESFNPGTILMMREVDEDEYVFLDFSHKMIFRLNTNSELIVPIGGQGEGPGEYRNPIYFDNFESKNIYFTDISSMFIKVLNEDNELVGQYEHDHGGGRHFLIKNDRIYIRGNLTHNLHVYDMEGNHIKDLFPLKEHYQNQMRYLDGGGIAVNEEKIFVMNGVEPVVYVIDLSLEEEFEFSPKAWQAFEMNDGYSLMNHSRAELGDELANITMFGKIHFFNHEGSSYLVVLARKADNHVVYYLNEHLEVVYHYYPDQSVIGFENSMLFERDVDSESRKINKVNFSIFN